MSDNLTLNQNFPCDHGSCWKSSLLGLRNGVYYGGRIRFFHALVMIMIFREGSLQERFKTILQLTYKHARNLGFYVFLYKSLVCILNKLRNQQSKYHVFISGALAGWLVFGRDKNAINQQLILYLLSRVIVGMAQNLQRKGVISKGYKAFPWLAAFCWGIVMLLFEDDKKCLQPSLASSMVFLYKDSDLPLRSWKQLIPLNFSFLQ